MPFTDTVRNAGVDAQNALLLYLALADDTNTELTGGSPAYARKAITWGAASAGIAANTNAMTFDIPAGAKVAFGRFKSASTAGTDYGWWAAGAQAVQAGVADSTTEAIASDAHGLSNDDRVIVMDISNAGVPTGLTEGTLYFVVNTATDTFKLATTSGGSAVNITADGELFFQKVIVETYANQGTYTVAIGDLKNNGTLI